MLCSPDEVLKALLDENGRANWDFGLRKVSFDADKSEITLSYHGGMGNGGTVRRDFVEKVQVSHLVFEHKFFIIEQVNSSNLKDAEDANQIPGGLSYDYERVWICEQV